MRALLSVADRRGIGDLARGLLELGVEVFATDGTREALEADGLEVAPITDLTAMPSIVGGQVKTFHAQVYAGIMARRGVDADMASLVEQDIRPIDLVVVNVRPFAPQVGSGLLALHEAVEMIDVGGTSLLSAAARNFAGVAVVCDPADYPVVLQEIRRSRARLGRDASAVRGARVRRRSRV